MKNLVGHKGVCSKIVYQHSVRAGGFDEEVKIFCQYECSQDLSLLYFMILATT